MVSPFSSSINRILERKYAGIQLVHGLHMPWDPTCNLCPCLRLGTHFGHRRMDDSLCTPAMCACAYEYLLCMYVCIYLSISLSVCLSVCLRECMYVCMYLSIYLCIYLYMYVCMYACMDVCMHVCMHACMHVCM